MSRSKSARFIDGVVTFIFGVLILYACFGDSGTSKENDFIPWMETDQPRSTVAPPRSTVAPPSPACIRWNNADDHLGEYECVCGTVTGTYADPDSSAFFINFTSNRNAFYVVSFDWRWDDLTGYCGMFCGEITEYQGRPQIKYTQQDIPPCP